MRKKSICILAFMAFFCLNSFSQKNNSYIKAGLNLANVSTTTDGRIDDANTLFSFHAGIIGDFQITPYTFIQPGLLFSGKGAKTSSGDPSDATYFKATSNPYYIEVPVNLVIKLPLADRGSNFFFGAGPYLAIGIAGKNKAEGKIFGVAFETDGNIEFSDDDPSTFDYEEGAGFGIMKRFDYGLNGTAGLELADLMIALNYGYGLAKLQSGSSSSNNDKNKHRVISVSIGFRL